MALKSRMARLTICVAALTVAVSGTPYAAEDNVSAAERAKIEGVVHDYLLAHPEVLVEALKSLQERQQAAAREQVKATLATERDALHHAKGDFVAGNPQGDVTLVEFFDYNCGYCRKAAQTVQALVADDSKLRVVFKEWPIRGEGSVEAARVSMAAQNQPKFFTFHLTLMNTPGEIDGKVALQAAREAGLDMNKLKADMKSPRIDQRLAETGALAQKLGLGGTPAFVLGDTIIPGAASEPEFKAAIDHTRAACTEKSC